MPSAKPFLHPLKTPKSATFPSELKSDSNDSLPSTSDIKQEQGSMSTPITPPAAYTEFLKAMTPVFSPVSAGASFPKFHFDKPTTTATTNSAHCSSTSQPASAVSGSFNFSEPVKSATAALPPSSSGAPGAPRRPARKDPSSLRRLHIPPTIQLSPADSPRSATTLRSPYSPSDWGLRYLDTPRSATPRSATPRSATSARSVSVRQVVTRTVTYKRMQLEAPPKGKRRKYESKD